MNFTRAARELDVTQSAVSRQIQLLEEFFGMPMFQRQSRGLTLTPEGQRLHRAVSMGLEHIANVSSDLNRQRNPGELTVATSVAFASYWLMARIAKFRGLHPHVEVRLVAASPIYDLKSEGIDIAVRYGAGEWPGVDATRLFDNEIWPVCAPSYLDRAPALAKAADFLGHTLLHLARYDRNWVTWSSFLEGLDINYSPGSRGQTFDNYMVLIQAALRGEGIALCGRRLAEDFIEQGDLVRPVPVAQESDKGFWLLRSRDDQLSERAKLFYNWLLDEARRPN